MKKLAFVAASLLATTAMPAVASPIVYTFNATVTGTNSAGGGGTFTNYTAKFTGIGNTNTTGVAFNGYPASQVLGVPLTSLTIFSPTNGSGTFEVTSPSFFYIYGPGVVGEANRRLGLGFDSSGNNALGLESAAFNGYSGLTNFSQTNAPTYFQNASFTTDRGNITITDFSNVTFDAAVPEPATWAMMLLGFGMMGFGLRASRKGKVTTRVAYA